MSGIVGGLNTRGSGLVLSSATDGQVLTATGAGMSAGFESAGGGAILQCISKQYGDRASDSTVTTTGTSGYDWTALGLAITPSSASNHLWIHGVVSFCHHSSYCGMMWVTYNHSGISEQVIASDHATYPVTYRIENAESTTDMFAPIAISVFLHPNTTNEVTIKFRTGNSNSSYGTLGLNNTTSGNTDSNDGMTPMSMTSVWEISGDISPSLTNATIDT